MKKLMCAAAVVMMVAAVAIAVSGCSKHESELEAQQRDLQESLEAYMETQPTGGIADKVPDPNAPEVAIIFAYVPSEGSVGLDRKLEDVPEIDDYELTQKLIEYEVLPKDAQVIDFDPENHVLEYTCVESLTPRQAMSVINTFTENMELEGQFELKLDGKTVMTSGFSADYENIDDSFEGGADDFEVSTGGPGVQ